MCSVQVKLRKRKVGELRFGQGRCWPEVVESSVAACCWREELAAVEREEVKRSFSKGKEKCEGERERKEREEREKMLKNNFRF